MIKDYIEKTVGERSFSGTILLAFTKADNENQAKLRKAWPEIAAMYDKFMVGG